MIMGTVSKMRMTVWLSTGMIGPSFRYQRGDSEGDNEISCHVGTDRYFLLVPF